MITDTQFFLVMFWLNMAFASIMTLFKPLLEDRIPRFYKNRKNFLRYQLLIILSGWSIYSLIQILVG